MKDFWSFWIGSTIVDGTLLAEQSEARFTLVSCWQRPYFTGLWMPLTSQLILETCACLSLLSFLQMLLSPPIGSRWKSRRDHPPVSLQLLLQLLFHLTSPGLQLLPFLWHVPFSDLHYTTDNYVEFERPSMHKIDATQRLTKQRLIETFLLFLLFRSVGGSYDNEGVAIFALIFCFYLWVKSVHTGSFVLSDTHHHHLLYHCVIVSNDYAAYSLRMYVSTSSARLFYYLEFKHCLASCLE